MKFYSILVMVFSLSCFAEHAKDPTVIDELKIGRNHPLTNSELSKKDLLSLAIKIQRKRYEEELAKSKTAYSELNKLEHELLKTKSLMQDAPSNFTIGLGLDAISALLTYKLTKRANKTDVISSLLLGGSLGTGVSGLLLTSVGGTFILSKDIIPQLEKELVEIKVYYTEKKEATEAELNKLTEIENEILSEAKK